MRFRDHLIFFFGYILEFCRPGGSLGLLCINQSSCITLCTNGEWGGYWKYGTPEATDPIGQVRVYQEGV